MMVGLRDAQKIREDGKSRNSHHNRCNFEFYRPLVAQGRINNLYFTHLGRSNSPLPYNECMFC